MRSVWFFVLCLVTDTLTASPLPRTSSGFDSVIAPRSEDGKPPSISGVVDGHQVPSKRLGEAAKLITALTGGYIGFKTLQSQRAWDTLANILGLSRKDSNKRLTNANDKPARGGNDGSDFEPSSGPHGNILAKIEREGGRIISDQDPATDYPSEDRFTPEQRECYRIKHSMLSGPEKYAYLKDGPQKFLEEWRKVCHDPERAKAFVETYHSQQRLRGGKGSAGGFNAVESVRLTHDIPRNLLANLGAVIRFGQKMGTTGNRFVKSSAGVAPVIRVRPMF